MTIAVLSGGSSLERDVSLRSGKRVAEALRERDHQVTMLDLDAELVEQLTTHDIDLVFLALHGKAGEDGSIQSLLDLLGISYTGSGATASALAWDKSVSKGVLRHAGVRTPNWHVLSEDAVREYGAGSALQRIASTLPFPLVVKPVQGGSSLGVHLIESADDLASAVMSAFQYHGAALLEWYVAGTEIAVSVMQGTVLPAVEIHARKGAYDFDARYTHGATEFHAPARLDAQAGNACADAAQRVWEALGCRDVVRVDMIVDAGGTPWVLEADTCPGLTETSLLPIAAKAAGVPFTEFCEQMVQAAAMRVSRETPAR